MNQNNQSEEFLLKLTKLTTEGGISWSISQPNDVTRFLLNGHKIIQVIETNYRGYSIYYVEQKTLDYDPESDQNYEVLSNIFLLVFSGILQMQIDESNTSGAVIYPLIKAIKERISKKILDDLLS